MWLHIRAIGTWTNKLYQYFDKRNQLKQSETLQLQLPKDQCLQSTMHELEREVRAWEDGSCDLDSLNDVHPMAVSNAWDQFRRDREGYVCGFANRTRYVNGWVTLSQASMGCMLEHLGHLSLA